MNECGGWRQIMPENEGFFKKAWYFIALVVLSVFYFFQTICECIWQAIRKR